MKKILRKAFAAVVMLALLVSSVVNMPANLAKAAPEEFLVFIAIGGDSEAGEWDVAYSGPDDAKNSANVTAVTAKVKNGETATVSLTVPKMKAIHYISPVVVVDGMALDASSTFETKVSLDGKDVTDTLNKIETPFWNEATGTFTKEQAVRIAGGFNEYDEKVCSFKEDPVGFTKIEYTIKLNLVEGKAATDVPAVESTSEYDAFIAFGGDAAAENDWGYAYAGQGYEKNAGEITGTDGKLKNGETTTLTLKFPSKVLKTWYVSPTINTNGDVFAEGTTFDVKVAIDGKDITDTIKFDVGDAFWNEETGPLKAENCVRIAGGYNDFAADRKYIPESPAGFTEITYTITPHIMIAGDGAGTDTPATPEVDLAGTYNAYFGVQTPAWSFRNAFDDEKYGKDSEFFNQFTGWADNKEVKLPGTITDAEITGNGTYKVSLTDFDLSNDFAEEALFKLLFVSVDMPVNDKIKFTDVKVIMDGETVYTFEEGIQDPDSTNVKLLAINGYNADVPVFSYGVPKKSIEIEFTVSGMTNDKTPEATEAPTVAPTVAPTQAATVAPTDADNGGFPTWAIVLIVVLVVAAIGGGVYVVKKKKSDN